MVAVAVLETVTVGPEGLVVVVTLAQAAAALQVRALLVETVMPGRPVAVVAAVPQVLAPTAADQAAATEAPQLTTQSAEPLLPTLAAAVALAAAVVRLAQVVALAQAMVRQATPLQVVALHRSLIAAQVVAAELVARPLRLVAMVRLAL